MGFTKSELKKQLSINGEDEAVEVIDLKMQYELMPDESYEDIRTKLHKRLDARFNEMFAVELGLLPARAEEGARWKQMGMFENV